MTFSEAHVAEIRKLELPDRATPKPRNLEKYGCGTVHMHDCYYLREEVPAMETRKATICSYILMQKPLIHLAIHLPSTS